MSIATEVSRKRKERKKPTRRFHILIHILLLNRRALKALRLECRINDDSLSTNGDTLGVGRPPFRLVGRAHLSRRFGQHIQAVKILARRKRHIRPLAFTLPRSVGVFILIAIGQIGELVQSQQDALAVTQRDGLTFLDEMVGQAVDATFGKFLAAGLAGVLVAVAGILELLASNEELEDELVGFATHCEGRMRDRVCCARARVAEKGTDSTGKVRNLGRRGSPTEALEDVDRVAR